MADLVARVLAIESAVNEIRSIVRGYSFKNNKKRPQNARDYARRGNQDSTPPWADQITRMLAQLLQDVKRETDSKSFDSNHGQNGDDVAPEIGLPAGSQQVDRYEDPPEPPTVPTLEPSQAVDVPDLLLQSPPSTNSIVSPRPNAESPIHHDRDSSLDTSRSFGLSTPESRSSDNSTTTSPSTDTSPIPEPALSKNTNAEESTERLSQHKPASPIRSQNDTGLCNAPTVRCTFVDIFNHDEETFSQICGDKRAQEHGYAKLEVNGLPPLNIDEDLIKHLAKDHAVHFSYEPDDASVKVNQSSKQRRVKLPKFPLSETAERNWPRAKLKAFVEETLKSPPREAIYIIGEQTFPYATLSPGEKLKRRGGGNLPGINTPYQYFSVSGGPTITIFHCEDGRLGSKNVVLEGENKVLVVVKPSSNQNFEDRMYERFPGARRDSQGIRHLARAIRPSLLDEWGVEYDIAGLAPGQGFATLPGIDVYHMVINMGDNLALAVNWEQPSSPDMPEGYMWCNHSCDPRAITARDFQLSDHPLAVPQKANVTRKRKRGPSPAGQKTLRTKPTSHEAKAQVDKPRALKESVLSTKGIVQHMARVRAFRSWDAAMKDKLRSSRTASEVEIDRLIQDCEGGELLQRFLKRLMQVQQEREIKARMKTQNLERATPAIIKDVLSWRRWPDTEEYRTKLRRERKQSARLEKICSGKNRGLLCFLPHEDSSLDMTDEDLQAFLSLIRRNDMVTTLCRIGADFEESILGNGKVPRYALENKDLAEVEQLSLKGQLALLTET